MSEALAPRIHRAPSDPVSFRSARSRWICISLGCWSGAVPERHRRRNSTTSSGRDTRRLASVWMVSKSSNGTITS